MSVPNFLSISDQVADYLQREILRGRWTGTIPGKHWIARELGINNKTAEAALQRLERSGLLIPQGAGKKRSINQEGGMASRALRIAVLLHEGEDDTKADYQVELHHALTAAGHSVLRAPHSLTQLRFDPKNVAAEVHQAKADAWIVCAGSREILEWFSQQPAPAFALFGQRAGLKIAAVGPDKPPAFAAATRQLIELGHRKIVLLCRRLRRIPLPGTSETAFLTTLHEHGIPPSSFHLPDWEETNAGFQTCLDALFRVTPPSALIVDEAPYFVAVMQFLLRRGIRVPQDISLICTDDNAAFLHCEPPIARISWDTRPVIRRVINWASNVSYGKVDTRQTLTPCSFKAGGSIGPVSVNFLSSHVDRSEKPSKI